MTHYRGDPSWIVARYAGSCEDCEQPVQRGSRILWWPKGRHVYCAECGQPRYARFVAEAQDEFTLSGGW